MYRGLTWITKTDSHSPFMSSQTLNNLWTQNPLKWRGGWLPFRKHSAIIYFVEVYPSLPLKTSHHFLGGKGKFRCWGSYWTLTLIIQGDPKHHCGQTVREGAYGSQVLNEILLQIPVQVYPVYPVVRTHKWYRHMQQLTELPNSLLDLWSKYYYFSKG